MQKYRWLDLWKYWMKIQEKKHISIGRKLIKLIEMLRKTSKKNDKTSNDTY